MSPSPTFLEFSCTVTARLSCPPSFLDPRAVLGFPAELSVQEGGATSPGLRRGRTTEQWPGRELRWKSRCAERLLSPLVPFARWKTFSRVEVRGSHSGLYMTQLKLNANKLESVFVAF